MLFSELLHALIFGPLGVVNWIKSNRVAHFGKERNFFSAYVPKSSHKYPDIGVRLTRHVKIILCPY